jgi:ABC-type sugar transport system ATPase subunit
MKNYLAVFVGSSTSPKVVEFMAMEESKRKKVEASGIKAWGDWMTAHSGDIVATGGPLGKTKRTTAQGVADVKNNLSGFVVVKAASHEAAAKMFENHPQFTIFPGDGVEVMEVLPIPGQAQH